MYLTVESACAHQCRVEHIGTVGGGKDYHSAVSAESVHLGKKGVEGVLALIVATHGGILGAGAAHGVNLVDEDNAR